MAGTAKSVNINRRFYVERHAGFEHFIRSWMNPRMRIGGYRRETNTMSKAVRKFLFETVVPDDFAGGIVNVSSPRTRLDYCVSGAACFRYSCKYLLLFFGPFAENMGT